MFYRARIKLTLWYVLMIMIISFLFSISIYQLQLRELRILETRQKTRIYRQLETHNMGPLVLELSFIDEAQNNLIINLSYLNGIIFILSLIFAWLLSGKTLQPIHAMVNEQSRFISDASHELKTPLTSLKTAFEVFTRSKKKTLKEAEIIISESIREVDRLQKLSDALLQLAQSQKPLPPQLFENVSMKSVLKAVIKQATPLAKNKQITISLSKIDVTAEILVEEINKLFIILIDNAIKYSPNKSKISIVLKKIRTECVVTITDKGIGIAEKDVPHIFDRFYRADSARTNGETGGYGLGLAIAQQIVQKHRGVISVKSSPGKGTTFTVRIPRKHILS